MGNGETFGRTLHRFRKRERLSLRAVGDRAHVSHTYVYEVERDLKRPSDRVAAALDTAVNAKGTLIAALNTDVTFDRNVEFGPPFVHMGFMPILGVNHTHDVMGEDETNRRQLLHIAAAGIGAHSFDESVRHLLDVEIGAARSVNEWTSTVIDDHLHALRSRPPAHVVKDLTLDLYTLRDHMAAAASGDRVELHRVAAVLACIQANALTRLADHGAAIRWWRTARQAADASGDLDLRLLVRGEEAGHGLYGQRSPRMVLQLIRNARQLTARPWPRLMTAEAEALAMLGRHQEAAHVVRTVEDLMERGVTADTVGFWKDDAIPFCQSWVYGYAGNETAADEAREQVLKLAPEHSYQVRTNVWLHRAACTVARGGVDTGVHSAAQLIDSLPTGYRTNHIRETARMVLRAVPLDQQSHPTVTDLRSLLALDA
ncbi:helix-turn-helix domain-containing protein [Nonomuraea polychroma]|uniref:helix-turn-helix domain-containing protein n=1 Tax=Nonomuraea polychroma TaxID=46176 RepID=UPI003D8C7B3F